LYKDKNIQEKQDTVLHKDKNNQESCQYSDAVRQSSDPKKYFNEKNYIITDL